MGAIRFLGLADVLELHDEQIQLYGGSDGVLNPGLLESAIGTPAMTFGGEYLHPDLPAMAAAYLFHLAMNHPFADGNKRVAAVAMVVFLRMNGWSPTFTEDELAEVTLSVADGTMDKEPLTEVVRAHVEPVGDA